MSNIISEAQAAAIDESQRSSSMQVEAAAASSVSPVASNEETAGNSLLREHFLYSVENKLHLIHFLYSSCSKEEESKNPDICKRVRRYHSLTVSATEGMMAWSERVDRR